MTRRTTPSRIAFTLVELLVVVAVFILLMAIAVPAFSSMLYSSEASMAENALRSGLAAGRDAAVRAGPGRDACVVFLYEDRRMMIVPCLWAGTVEDVRVGTNEAVTREVFAPISGFEPIRLPGSWMVRGYATPRMIDDDWYEHNYETVALRNQGNWLFPENDFYDYLSGDETSNGDDTERQSFVVRFEGGTGMLKTDAEAVLVLFPSSWTVFRTNAPWDDYRANEEPDGARFVARVRAAPVSGTGALDLQERQQLLGDRATDTILCKPVGQLALANERKLAAAMDLVTPPVRIDRDTGCLYREVVTQTPREPEFVPNLDPQRLNEWIENRLVSNGEPVESEARLFTVHRYLGTLQEVTGTVNAQGVTQ